MLVFTLSALLTSFLFVLADPAPTAPGPGDKFNEGTDCTFTWDGDSNTGSTIWKVMNVELMSGSNFGMTHLTTVATSLDGTTSGTESFPCPEVTPNSAIYFYQFSSPLSSNVTWTTRFTIADANGQSTPPTEAKQPNTGDPIPWGHGALVDPSLAVPAPIIGGSNSTPSAIPPSSNSTSLTTSSTPASSTSSLAPATTVISKTSSSTSSGSTGSVTSSSSTTGTGTGGAVGLIVDSRVWQSVVALGAAAFTFAVLL